MTLPFILRATDPRLTNTPSTNFLTRNPFLIFRLVFLALLGNLAILSLIFASWNIHAELSIGYPVTSSSAFAILETCVFFICGTLSIMAFFRRKHRMSYTIVECGWVGVLSLFYTGTAIAATVAGPALVCRVTSDWGVCASSTVLVSVLWISSYISLAYFFAMFVTALAHQTLYPDIWTRSIYTIEWFGQPQQLPSREPREKVVKSFFKSKPVEKDPFDWYDDVESSADSEKQDKSGRDSLKSSEEFIPWRPAPVPIVAPQPIRRGIDPPFVTKPRSAATSPTLTSLKLPLSPLTFPERLAGPGASGSRYLETFRDSTILSRQEDVAQYTTHYHQPRFPSGVPDINQPVPLTHKSAWVKAGNPF
ncbi:hypothetical protein CPC08DRAFT_748461 [Agrocybe pediades]|nr:hypothetical protein CPC08DRAFT_748461 [Agrocybe pediades]